MPVEIKIMGELCNLQCAYCFQSPLRKSRRPTARADLDSIKAAIEREGRGFSLFGGEPLLAPREVLASLWSWGFEKFGRTSLQTNGMLIDEWHIAQFKRYCVHVGISADGPDALNDARWCGSIEKTREATSRVLRNIERLCECGLPPGLIVTLHRRNASADRLGRLMGWIGDLEKMGVRFVRLHMLEVDEESTRGVLALTEAELAGALDRLSTFESSLQKLRFDMFSDMKRMLMGQSKGVTCVWNGCDPHATQAVLGIGHDGSLTNCGRTNKDGMEFLRSGGQSYLRCMALHRAPQEQGGCAGCRFFLMCKGHCPGMAAEGDWRNKTEYCGVLKSLFEKLEREMMQSGLTPLSRHPQRDLMEARLMEHWSRGKNPPLDCMATELGLPSSDPSAWRRCIGELRALVSANG